MRMGIQFYTFDYHICILYTNMTVKVQCYGWTLNRIAYDGCSTATGCMYMYIYSIVQCSHHHVGKPIKQARVANHKGSQVNDICRLMETTYLTATEALDVFLGPELIKACVSEMFACGWFQLQLLHHNHPQANSMVS